jgi:hypothetical protein
MAEPHHRGHPDIYEAQCRAIGAQGWLHRRSPPQVRDPCRSCHERAGARLEAFSDSIVYEAETYPSFQDDSARSDRARSLQSITDRREQLSIDELRASGTYLVLSPAGRSAHLGPAALRTKPSQIRPSRPC